MEHLRLGGQDLTQAGGHAPPPPKGEGVLSVLFYSL